MRVVMTSAVLPDVDDLIPIRSPGTLRYGVESLAKGYGEAENKEIVLTLRFFQLLQVPVSFCIHHE